ncbi:tRNA adenosine(34) deaminase TadA [Xylophilus sp.]|uniref:tRNA adenosine(34) deaminase TadA n=1 Tax=Xylophilus sp. TaxID=2653893 RepID=UPI0013BA7867|nr:tRNA adenosine(34) deaminase TadA [Xylophilus sp.]KAF1047197.1 MAG: tRNA-specific adenosine deaminase [Xylophilus sp.]
MPAPAIPASEPPLPDDSRYMALALAEARAAAAAGEVPVGAVVVRDGRVIATGRNAPIATADPTAHAEIVALRAAAAALGNYRLDGCTLYVTLEPCAMCSGAMLHARVARVVYGAADPRTGAAGSVVDLFGEPRLNHHTRVEGGVEAAACSALLSDFFRARRAAPSAAAPLREDALRTPAGRFAPDAHLQTLAALPALAGLQLAWSDLPGRRAAGPAWLCLHAAPGWGHDFSAALPVLAQGGARVVVPDLPGFGRSDKPKRESAHSLAWHAEVLAQFVDHLGLRAAVLLAHRGAAAIALALVAQRPDAFAGLLLADPRPARWRSGSALGAQCGGDPAYDAPFPDNGHRAALRAFAAIEAAPPAPHVQAFWRDAWRGRSLVLAAPGRAADAAAQAVAAGIRGCPPPEPLDGAGAHPLPARAAERAVEYFAPFSPS